MDDLTRAAGSCPRCGSPLAADAPEGLCASCLLAAGVETLTKSTDDTPTVLSGWDDRAAGPDGQRLAAGVDWGPYRIGRLLGRGGMGEVYEAEQRDSGRRIALKVLRSRLQNRDERARFLREGQLAASISHPHTVYIFGSEEVAGMPVISMELLPGGTLKDRVVEHGPLPIADAVAAILDVIGGLDAAQAAGILHRDIKPSNCFIDHDGAIKVGDFGLSISTLARDVRGEIPIDDSGFQGTPQFAPPEQLRGEPLDVRADIYAVGATLYYLLAGRAPFDAPTLHALVERVTSEPPPPLRTDRPGIPPRLAAVVMQCLEKDPARRPVSYAALAEALRPFAAIDAPPARLGLRFMAGVIDTMIVSAAVMLWRGATLSLMSPDGLASSFDAWAWVARLVYYLIIEVIWGASLGKQLFGLRLAGTNGPISRRQIVVRTLMFHVPNLIGTMAIIFWLGDDGLISVTSRPAGSSGWSFSPSGDTSGILLTLTALLFVTARRRNGWAGLHELGSATRVVAHAVVPLRRAAARSDAASMASLHGADARRYGPFIAVSDRSSTAGHRGLVTAFDPVLRRHVWIHEVADDAPPVPAARRDVGRIGRLHWLTGRRTAGDSWDAYEAPDGGALLELHRSGFPWSRVKLWLLDLVHELAVAERDHTTPPLALDRVWIRGDGRALLLDFPAPAANTVPVDAGAHAHLSPPRLLAAVAGLLVGGSGPAPTFLPVSVRTLLAAWSSDGKPTFDEMRRALIEAAASPDEVSRTRRAVPIAIAAAPAVMLVALSLLLVPLLNQFLSSPQAEMMRWLEALNRPTPLPNSRLVDPAIRQAVERYVVGRYGASLTSDDFWRSPVMQNQAAQLRPLADDLARRHSPVSAEELATLTVTIAPELERFRRASANGGRGAAPPGEAVTNILAALGLIFTAVVSLLSALLVPGGVATRLAGLAVVGRDGASIGRLRSVGRALITWSPALVWCAWLWLGPRVQGWAPAPRSPLLPALAAFGVLAAGAAWTLTRPARGPHDIIAGTWVAPR